MKYYKQINIDNFEIIQQKTLSFIIKMGHMDRMGFHWLQWKEYVEWCPEILTAFSKFNINPIGAATISTRSIVNAKVHVDTSTGPTIKQCRINLPILNCEGSRTEFYTGGEYNIAYTLGNNPFMVLKEDSAPTKVDELELTAPTVLRVLEPHRVIVNMERIPRISLSVDTDIDPLFLLT